MGRRTAVTVHSRAREFSEHFYVEGSKLMCRFCSNSINWKIKTIITTHISSESHKTAQRKYNAELRNDRQISLESSLTISDAKKKSLLIYLKPV